MSVGRLIPTSSVDLRSLSEEDLLGYGSPGVLEIVIPKQPKAQPRRITVK